MLKTILSMATATTLAMPAVAQSLDAGVAAFQTGDYKTAYEHFRPLAEKGEAAAQFWLGSMYSTGYGVTENDPEAVKWMKASARQGYVDAQVALGGIYFLGRDAPPDYVSSQMWLIVAGENGFSGTTETSESLKSFLTDEQAEDAVARAQVCLKTDYADCD